MALIMCVYLSTVNQAGDLGFKHGDATSELGRFEGAQMFEDAIEIGKSRHL